MATKNKKLWAGRFKAATDKIAEELNASIAFDKRLFRQDIRGSIAHAMTLKKARVLTAKEASRIITGLKAVEAEIASGKFKPGAEYEDIHMAVEARLTQKIGPLGGKLHTGRSRNDQVALDIRMYLKDEIAEIQKLLTSLKQATYEVALKNADTVMPGYTHLQRAQPVLLAHHMLAYYEMFTRDSERLLDVFKRADSMPLGSGALAGSPYKLDRFYTARLLKFSRVTENSMDAVGDRDFIIEFLAAASIIMMHLSRLSEELIIWASNEFSFIELSDEYSTGSSIMPQKKNPDMAELARGKTGRVYGSLISVLTTMKALPLAYNKDMQEDKEPLFDAIDTLKAVLAVFTPMIKKMRVNKAAMRKATAAGFLTATDAADYLVKRGLPFRNAHEVAGKIVAYCIEKDKTLEDLTMDEWKKFSPLFSASIKDAVKAESSLTSRVIYGGTGYNAVKKRLTEVKKKLKKG
ncbi:MAG: argininosuccinate lyase [Deltaproteobacteria bacterium]|nr:argininosuccinate lyase [Deltaproteobacteria bacterium]